MAQPREPSPFEIMRDTGRRGTPVALLAFVSVAFMGCLVTTDIDVPEPPLCPPVILSSPTGDTPIGQVIRADPDAHVEFEVLIRDCNQFQAIETLAILDWDRQNGARPTIFSQLRLTTRNENEPEFVTFQFTFDGPLEANACHKVELLASGRFDLFSPSPTDPVAEGDIGVALWWLLVDDEDPVTEVPLSDCR
jgi:hypothetical protein